jgi:transcriptional regulator with XRE-family HTH domain
MMVLMSARRVKLSEQIRRAVLGSGKSRYALCKQIGLSQSTMSRFVNGTGGLGMEMLDKLADVLDINLADTPKKDR